jgi:hypothetical protein
VAGHGAGGSFGLALSDVDMANWLGVQLLTD